MSALEEHLTMQLGDSLQNLAIYYIFRTVTQCAAAAAPTSNASFGPALGPPLRRPLLPARAAAKAPRKQSPAPVVSTTQGAGKHGCRNGSALVVLKSMEPPEPTVTSTLGTPASRCNAAAAVATSASVVVGKLTRRCSSVSLGAT